eukprot:scaffold1591_cov109-Isochrysis_galbana.AAC.8
MSLQVRNVLPLPCAGAGCWGIELWGWEAYRPEALVIYVPSAPIVACLERKQCVVDDPHLMHGARMGGGRG